ncbi:steryl-sulfatase-like [Glandiceps talaboti]
MNVTKLAQLSTLLGVLVTLFCSVEASAKPKKPNFVLLMVDDLGMGDVGCFGNDTIRTPNMDSIARQGAKLSHHVAPAPLCTPSRIAFITGRHPIRSGMLGYGRFRMIPFLAATAGLPSNETTFAEELRQVGYKTALIGKWHMGLHCGNSKDYCHHPLQQGFDFFYGLPLTNLRDCGADTSRSVVTAWCPLLFENISCTAAVIFLSILLLYKLKYITTRGLICLTVMATVLLLSPIIATKGVRVINCLLMKNYDVVEQPVVLENLTLRFTKQAVQFIQQNQNDPFVLFMSYAKVHTALFSSQKFKGISRHGRYGDNVEEADWSVGEILSALEKLGLKDDTFVFLTSDNGAHLEELGFDGQREGGYNGIYKGMQYMSLFYYRQQLPKLQFCVV